MRASDGRVTVRSVPLDTAARFEVEAAAGVTHRLRSYSAKFSVRRGLRRIRNAPALRGRNLPPSALRERIGVRCLRARLGSVEKVTAGLKHFGAECPNQGAGHQPPKPRRG